MKKRSEGALTAPGPQKQTEKGTFFCMEGSPFFSKNFGENSAENLEKNRREI